MSSIAEADARFDFGEDPDDWLNIDADMLDGMLKSRSNLAATIKTADGGSDPAVDEEEDGDEMTSGQATRLQKLAGKVGAFVEGEGVLEGAKFEE